ncbi:MAG: NAD(P)H-dependent oxidoreductase [bacterium]|nr:NAD(P)H-dependent oxidoreductase [bacterium]
MRIALLPGSLRAGSYNRKLARVAADVLAGRGVETDYVDLKEHPMPPYDGDIEAASGLPDACWKFKARIAAAHAVVIASPEYSGGIPGTLKNVLDWSTRGGSNPWDGKVVLLMGTSGGPWGTNRMLPALRQVMAIMGAVVIPQSVTIPNAGKVWDESGALLDETLPGRVEKVLGNSLTVPQKMTAERL